MPELGPSCLPTPPAADSFVLLLPPDRARILAEAPVERLYVDTDETDVKLCPGDRTHHEIINRRGFRDTGAFNPHERVPDAWRHFVSVPSARVARPITCAAYFPLSPLSVPIRPFRSTPLPPHLASWRGWLVQHAA